MAKYEYKGKSTLTFQGLPGYKNIVAWQAASDLSWLTSTLVRRFGPGYFKFADQMRGAASSVHANIAEGYCSGTLPNYIRHAHIAHGSLGELGSFFQDCERDDLINGAELVALLKNYKDAVFLLERLLQALIQKNEQGSWDKSYAIREPTTVYHVNSEPEFLSEINPNPDLAD